MSYLAFIALCGAWGGTWLAIRVGVDEVPPLWLAGTRFAVAGLLLLLLARWIGGWRLLAGLDVGRILLMAMGAISICFGLIFWGEQYVDSGTAGVIVQGFVPIGLFFFAATLGRETIRRGQLFGLVTGLAGVSALMLAQATVSESRNAILGVCAIIIGTLVYDWAGVYGKPIFERYPAPFVSALENLFGGLLLLPFSLVIEGSRIADQGYFPATGAFWTSWLYLVFIGSMVGFTAYTYLLGAWGASRTSTYAFVTPVVALAIGASLGGEELLWQHLAGAALILLAVRFMLGKPSADADASGRPVSEPAPAHMEARAP